MTKKVFVGLSGGVDSSVSALLLKKRGFEVVGVFIKVWEPPESLVQGGCSWREDMQDASKIAASLDIPFLTVDLSFGYKKHVVDYMIKEYSAGRTPNPDIMCNKYIKFGLFFDWAKQQGADYVATGHYARLKEGKLYTGIDLNKDQSYFLWNIKKDNLLQTIFPVGDLQKEEVRKIASDFNLVTATKKDSQGVCFIGKLNIKDFLKEYIEEKPGLVINEQNEVIGKHEGVFFYTLGERRGFTITKKTPHDKPYYVIDKDIDKNLLKVSQQRLMTKLTSEINLIDENWLDEIEEDKEYQIRTRYRQDLQKAIFKNKRVIIQNPTEYPTPGQSLVVYDNNQCLGGGIVA